MITAIYSGIYTSKPLQLFRKVIQITKFVHFNLAQYNDDIASYVRQVSRVVVPHFSGCVLNFPEAIKAFCFGKVNA